MVPTAWYPHASASDTSHTEAPAILAGAASASHKRMGQPASTSHDQTELAIHWFARVRWL